MKIPTLLCVICGIFATSLCVTKSHAAESHIVNLDAENAVSPAVQATIARKKPRGATTIFVGQWQPWKNKPVVLLHIYAQNEIAWLQIYEKRGTLRQLRYVVAQTLRVGNYRNDTAQISTIWVDKLRQTPALIIDFGDGENDGTKTVMAFARGWKTEPAVLRDLRYFKSESPFGTWRTLFIGHRENGDFIVTNSDQKMQTDSYVAAGNGTNQSWIWNRDFQKFMEEPAPNATPISPPVE